MTFACPKCGIETPHTFCPPRPTEIRAEQPRPALKEFRTALNALYLEVEPSIANDIVKLATAAIAEAESKPALPAPRQDGWISVEERLPEDRKAVLVAHENLGNWVWVATRVSGQWKQSHNHDIEFNTGEITHWQPLPKPPELGLGESREPLPSDVPK